MGEADIVVARNLDAGGKNFVANPSPLAPNTAPFDITHHPAMTVTCGMADGLPVRVIPGGGPPS